MRTTWVTALTAVLAVVGCGGQSVQHDDTAQPSTLAPLATQADAGPTEASSESATPCQDLMTRLCADLGPTTDTCQIVQERTAEVGDASCRRMTQHYDEVLAELQEYEAQNQPLSADKLARAIDGATTTAGPSNAAVTILLFSDFQCPFCAGAAATTQTVKERYGEKVRVVFRQFPLPFHRNAHAAAEASLAASAEGKFWPMHDLLFANQRELDRASLSVYAREIGLDVVAFDRALDAGTYAAAVDADLALGVELGVNATPTMFLNGQRVPNASDLEDVTARIDGMLSTTPTPL